MRRKNLLILATMLILPLGLGVLGISSYWMRDEMVEAAAEGNITQLSRLRLMGASPSFVGWEDHFTPLTAAIQGEQSATVRYLLEAGADPLVVDDHRENAFQAAARVNNPTILALLHPHRPR